MVPLGVARGPIGGLLPASTPPSSRGLYKNFGTSNTENQVRTDRARHRVIDVRPSLDYVAGFFDGEGSVVVRSVKDERYRAGYRVSVKVTFTQKDRGILEAVRTVLGMGHIYHHSRDDTWYLEIYRRDDLRVFVETLAPRCFVKGDDLRRLGEVLDMLDEGVHGTEEGVRRIVRFWRSGKGG